jgi:hypothetical protein
MAPWVRSLFIHMLPRLLLMKRPSHSDLEEELAREYHPVLMEKLHSGAAYSCCLTLMARTIVFN